MYIAELLYFQSLALHLIPILLAILVLLSIKCLIYFLIPELHRVYRNIIAFIVGLPNDDETHRLRLWNQGLEEQLARLERRYGRLEASVQSLEDQQKRSVTSSYSATTQLRHAHEGLTREVDKLRSRENIEKPQENLLSGAENWSKLQENYMSLFKSVAELRTDVEKIMTTPAHILGKNQGKFIALSSRVDDVEWKSRTLERKIDVVEQENRTLEGKIDDVKRENRTLQTDMHYNISSVKSDIEHANREIRSVSISNISGYGKTLEARSQEISTLNSHVTELQLINADRQLQLNRYAKRLIELEKFCTGLANGVNKTMSEDDLAKYWGEEFRKDYLHGGWKEKK
ncbi:MAG: hypothetical protein Q9220_007353 [cf. Caloplaca sp. 1 TL-2023]